MKQIIYFKSSEKPDVYRFVKSYRRGRWYRKERIEYSFFPSDAVQFTDNVEKSLVCERIKKDFPDVSIFSDDFLSFMSSHKDNRFWVIAQHDFGGDGISGFYCGFGSGNKAAFSTDIYSAEIIMSKSSALETLRTIQRSAGGLYSESVVYLSIANRLLSPCMMITCTNRRSNITKYFSRLEEGNRLRLVKTSVAARKFCYDDALSMFERLRMQNKNFLYAILPAFKDNVHCKDIESYMREKKVSRMITMGLQLKHLNNRK